MIRYLPWREDVLQSCLELHASGSVATLDLDLTAKCTFAKCVYCDSKPGVGQGDPDELSLTEILGVLQQAGNLGVKWLYSCGLGEPLEDGRFEEIVRECSKRGIRISLFTNGIDIDRETARFLRKNRVCLIVKLDSLVEENFDIILGGAGMARRIYSGIECLLDAGYGSDGADGTELAFSIVPTKVNVKDIPDVISFAKKHCVFPSIGELEQAGLALSKGIWSKLAINDDDLFWLRNVINEMLWEGYKRPICPTIISGVHIDNVGNCVVDKDTGLNCKWFLLEEPTVLQLGNVKDKSLRKMFDLVKSYRRDMFSKNATLIDKFGAVSYEFGGCGGDPAEVIKLAKGCLD